MSILIDADDRHRTSTAINPQPFSQTKDYVEVVRCKDCKYFVERNNTKLSGYGFCADNNAYFEPDNYCSHGERRANDV